jgi:hypothetical protein
MTKYIFLTILLLIASFSYSQEINGKYFNDNEFINLNSDTAEFHVKGNGGLIVYLNGIGNYELNEEFLLIHAKNYTGKKSTFSASQNESGFVTFTAIDSDRKFLFGVNILLLSETGDILKASNTNENGFLKIANNDNAEKIKLSLLGYDTFSIDYKSNTDYSLTLFEEEVIENQTVVFKINENNNNSLKLTLLTTEFEFNPKTVLKDLKKLDRKSLKFGFQVKELKKE